MENYAFYCADTETTSLDLMTGDIIELSIYRMENDEQKTWCLKPLNPDRIDPGALRVNGHKLDDLLWRTKEGKDRYLEPTSTLVEIEDWLAQDNLPAEKRFLIAHNASYDKNMMEQLWIKCNAKDSFPFGRRFIDTMTLELAIDYAKGQFAEGYSLNNLVKKYGVKNEKVHSASADTLATKQVFDKQIKYLRDFLKKEI
jgi:DNA polymerase III alpha subunit (gram-positive type)